MGPRLFAACIYGRDVFSRNNYYFWIPVIAPIVGAIIGVWMFEGYLILMKKYANLPGIIHIAAIEQTNENGEEDKGQTTTSQPPIESY